VNNLLENLSFDVGEGTGSFARIGLVVLASDYTIENEFRQVFKAPEVDFYTARIANSPQVTPATLADMESRIASTASLILPGDRVDVMAYCCTSASVVLGEDVVFDQLAKAHPKALYTTPVTAARAALQAFGAKRIAVLTPYRSDINQQINDYFAGAGYSVEVFGSFNEEMDPVVARIDIASIEAALQRLLADTNVDAVFVSCTSIRMMHAIEALEARFKIPVTCSNQALAWHCQHLAGNDKKISGLGSLFELSAC